MKISFILPSRDNLKYLKWSYDSIRKNQGNHAVQICVADDFSSDGTWDWCQKIMKEDIHFNAIRNEGPVRLGHTILYDKLVNDVSKHEVCMIYHADMYLCPGALNKIQRYMYDTIHHDHVEGGFDVIPKYKTIVSLTRIEPSLHPPGPEKILHDLGTEPENFDEDELLSWFNKDLKLLTPIDLIASNIPDRRTEGIFAPWAFFKKDFQEIGGHDKLYAPQSKEDSDIFNRFQLNGVKFIQTWEGFVYHMTCRGSRYNPTLTTVGKESPEWLEQNQRSTKNFIRKWGHFVKHDAYMKPIIPHKYDITLIPQNLTTVEQLGALEPWCSRIYTNNYNLKDQYIKLNQKDTLFDLSKRIVVDEGVLGNIKIRFDVNLLNQQSFNFLMQLSEILEASAEIGNMEYDIFKIQIHSLDTYEDQLIVNDKEYYKKDIYISETMCE